MSASNRCVVSLDASHLDYSSLPSYRSVGSVLSIDSLRDHRGAFWNCVLQPYDRSLEVISCVFFLRNTMYSQLTQNSAICMDSRFLPKRCFTKKKLVTPYTKGGCCRRGR